MQHFFSSKPLILIYAILLALVCLAAVNYVIIIKNGTPVPVPTTPRTAEHYGQGTPLTYVVLGDSTAVAQGAAYDSGYARTTARFLASEDYGVTLYNFAVSGARAADVAAKQVPQAVAVKPEIVLVAVGANDVTHLTSIGTIRTNLNKAVDALRAQNSQVIIIVTGSPQMGAVPRFPEPTKTFARIRTAQVNRMVRALASEKQLTFAPIAEKTGPIFMAHPEYFAEDKFHPNGRGYAAWLTVLMESLRGVITSKQ